MSAFAEYTEPVWRGLNMRTLKVDEAYLILKSFYTQETYLYSLSDECFRCPYTKVKALPPHNATEAESGEQGVGKLQAIKLDVAHALSFKVYDSDVGRYAFENETSLCAIPGADLEEFGVYNLTVLSNGSCAWHTDKPGVNVNLSLLSVFALLTLSLAVIKISACAWRSYSYDVQRAAATVAVEADATANPVSSPTRNRLRSLDVFRGLAIVLMIFVNSGGGHYWWIEHAAWNGLHLADIVFPSFLWIMGVCLPVSVKSQLARGATRLQVCRRIFWRSLKLFAIGLCLNSINGPQLEQLRIMGVLQRFGIAYLVCGVVHTVCVPRQPLQPVLSRWQRALYDLRLLRGEFLFMLLLLATHLALVFGLRVPQCPSGYLGPGGKHDYVAHPNCTGGATGYIDLQLLGNAHIYQHPTAKYVYDATAFDPEGVFGCLLTVVQVMLGLLAGVIILVHSTWRARMLRWLSWSLLLAVIGGALCSFSQEAGVIPVNKNLWSLSFVCVTSGLAFCALSILYYLIDVRHCWSGFPFMESGMNAIIMYVGHTIMHKMLPWHWRIGAMNTHFVLLLESLWNTLLWIGIAVYLDSKQLYYSL